MSAHHARERRIAKPCRDTADTDGEREDRMGLKEAAIGGGIGLVLDNLVFGGRLGGLGLLGGAALGFFNPTAFETASTYVKKAATDGTKSFGGFDGMTNGLFGPEKDQKPNPETAKANA